MAKNFDDTISNENYPFAKIAAKYDFHPSVSYTYQIGVTGEKFQVKISDGQFLTVEMDLGGNMVELDIAVDRKQ